MSEGRESVWEYPRPPRLERSKRRIRVYFDGELIADSSRTLRVLETSHPPTYYIPKEDINQERLRGHPKRTLCEFKGQAKYYTLESEGKSAEAAAWEYPEPPERYRELTGHIAFYAGAVDECYVDDEQVDAQAGSFYGGWITSDIEGPFKGGPGTMGW
jgi:uncharacterized protein (DUF427 family)